MQERHWILALVLPCFLLVTSGCMQQEFVYVDEFGNELAVDAKGRPLIPRHGAPRGDTMTPAAVTVATPTPAVVAPTSQPADAAAATEQAPAAVDASNELDMPPAPAATSSAANLGVDMPAAGAAAPKQVESSSKLDIPPAG